MKMKYTCEIIIDKSIDIVTKSMVDYKAMQEWQDSLLKVEAVKGTPGQENSVTMLYYEGDMVMTETIEKNLLPKHLIQIYQVSGVKNRCVNEFTDLQGKTQWTLESEFIFEEDIDLSIDVFKKKTLSGMELLKDYLENEQ